MLSISVRNVMNLISFNLYRSRFYYKIVILMEKKTSKVVVEILKAILYAVLGLLGGQAAM